MKKKLALDAKKKEQKAAEQDKKKQMAEEKLRNTIVNKYKKLILNIIGQNWIMPKNRDQNSSVKLLIHLAPGGDVISVILIKTSGDKVLDTSAITAIWKSSPLPVPKDNVVFNKFRTFNITVRPEGRMNN